MRRSAFALAVCASIVMVGCTSAVYDGEDASVKAPRSKEAGSAASAPADGASARGFDDAHAVSDAVPARAPSAHFESEASGDMAFDAPAAESAPLAPPSEPAADADIARGPEPAERQRRELQSGILTAGSFDDVERFDDYRKFLTDAMQNDAGETFPRWAIGERVVIRVENEQGKPVGDARVVVRPAGDDAQSAAPLLDARTASDGRAMFLTALDGASGRDEFAVTVHPAGGGNSATATFQPGQQPWKITLPDAMPAKPTQLDLALVIDTTGSMGDELEYLKVEIDSIAAAVHDMFPKVDQRFALIVYRDQGDAYVSRTFDYTGSLDDFRDKLSQQIAAGGGDYPEAMHVAMEAAAQLSWRESDAARVLFLVGDAPPHDEHLDRTLKAGLALRKAGVRVYPIGASGVAMKAEFIMRATAFATMGQYLFLTDHSGVGNPHAKPHVPEYQVERLDRLMIRMIASELIGRRLAADEIIAIERGDDTPETVIPENQQSQSPPRPHTTEVAASTPSLLRDIPAWILFAILLLGVVILDANQRTRA